MIFANIGEGSLVVVLGTLMQNLSYDWLIYGMMFGNFAIFGLIFINSKFMSQNNSKLKCEPLLKSKSNINTIREELIEI